MGKVRCVDCGLFTFKHHEKGWIEIGPEVRKTYSLMVIDENQGISNSDPRCFAMEFDLTAECGGTRANWTGTKFAQTIIGERECPSFIEWKNGFSPKEHAQMSFAREAQREATAARERERAWQEDQKRKDRRWNIMTLIISSLLTSLFSLLGFFAKLLFDHLSK